MHDTDLIALFGSSIGKETEAKDIADVLASVAPGIHEESGGSCVNTYLRLCISHVLQLLVSIRGILLFVIK